MYHEVLDDSAPINAWTVVKKSHFIRQMEYLQSNFRIVSLDEAFQSIYLQSIQTDKNIAVITFDDGYSGNRKVVFPIIESMGVPVTIFVSTGTVQNHILNWYDSLITALQHDGQIQINLERFNLGTYNISSHHTSEGRWIEIEEVLAALKKLTPDTREEAVRHILEKFDTCQITPVAPLSISEIREMSKSPFVTFGAHSHCHNRLIQLDKEKIKVSIERSKSLLEEWTDKPMRHFAYPNGDYNQDVISCLKEAGFDSGLTTLSCLWRDDDSPFTIPRIGIGRYDSFESFKAKVSGILL